MTRNTVLLGLSIGRGSGADAVRACTALAGYILGVAWGALLPGTPDNLHGRRAFMLRAATAEAALLAVFAGLWAAASALPERQLLPTALVAVSGVAMGLQSAVVKRFSLPGIVTTYITGTITSLVSAVTNRLSGRRTAAGAASAGFEPRIRLQAQVFAIYGVAALVSALLYSHWHAAVGLLPMLAILLAGACGLRRKEQGLGVRG
jgi:uncharacterized membrane protein YoaK (UPF0700 family)